MKESVQNLFLFIWYRIVGRIFWVFPIRKKRVLFQSFFGKGFGDNPKYILEELKKRNIDNIEFVWLIKKNQTRKSFPDEVKLIERFTFGELYYLATSRVWVDNSRKHYGVCKRKKQFYIQTWHGGLGFKKIEKSAHMGKFYEKSARQDSRMCDLMLSGSKWQTKLIQSEFWYNGEILESGLPREDIWFQNIQTYDQKRIKVGTLADKRYVLYAPTFRKSRDVSVYNIDFTKLLTLLEKHWGGKWVALIRLHPNVANKVNCIKFNDRVIDATSYADINQLIYECDLFISDYSSCVLDSIWANKPSVIYAPDVSDYEAERGFLISPKDYPLPCAENNEELQQAIENFDKLGYKQRYSAFKEQYGVVAGGRGAKKAVDYLLEKIDL